MIRLEDPNMEQFALELGDVAVPLEIYRNLVSDVTDMTVYARFSELAGRLRLRFDTDLLSPEAIQYAQDALTDGMRPLDFLPSPDTDNRIDEFILRSDDPFPSFPTQPQTRILRVPEDMQSLRNCTSQEIILDGEGDVCAVSVEGHRIVACAAINDTVFEDGALEVSVECVPERRNEGRATACVAALTRELLNQGYAVRYHCRSRNDVSRHIAQKLGFTHAGIRYSFVFYRRELL